jgi:hypothetical protein
VFQFRAVPALQRLQVAALEQRSCIAETELVEKLAQLGHGDFLVAPTLTARSSAR